jgi:hypothetical protein
MIAARASSRCELCRRERESEQQSMESLPEESVAHIQNSGCKAQRKSVIGHTISAGRTYYVPSSSMGRRDVISNSLGKTKTGK